MLIRDAVLVGCVSLVGQKTFNIARNGVLAAGFSERVPATPVDRYCGSAQQALNFLAWDPFRPALTDRHAPGVVSQCISAELFAAHCGLDRDAIDASSAQSHRRADASCDDRLMSADVLTLPVDRGDGPTSKTIYQDDLPQGGYVAGHLARVADCAAVGVSPAVIGGAPSRPKLGRARR